MLDQTQPDANQVENSSASTAAAPEQIDDKPNQVPEAESSTAKTTDDKDPQSADDVISSVMTAEQKDTESSPVEDEKVKEETEASKTEDSEPQVPFHDHPRWKAVLKERDEAKTAMDTMKSQVERVAQLEQYCKSNNISQDQFVEVMEIAALLNSDPARAWERMKPIVDQLQQFKGDVLPSDLQQEVEDGTLSAQRAKEIAQFRMQTKVSESRAKVSTEQYQQQQVQATQSAVATWDSSKRQGDPDFAPKTAADQPDGLWELVRDRFNTKIQTSSVRTPQDAVALAEQAYREIKKSLSRFNPPKKPMRTLSSSTTSTTARPKIESADDVINLIASGAKLKD